MPAWVITMYPEGGAETRHVGGPQKPDRAIYEHFSRPPTTHGVTLRDNRSGNMRSFWVKTSEFEASELSCSVIKFFPCNSENFRSCDFFTARVVFVYKLSPAIHTRRLRDRVFYSVTTLTNFFTYPLFQKLVKSVWNQQLLKRRIP